MANNGRFTSDFEGVLIAQGTSMPKGADVRAILRFVERRWLLVVGITLAVAAFMAALAFTAHPRYVAEAVVLLEGSSGNITDSEPLTKDVQVSPEVVRSELDVIKSREVVEKVIQQLHLVNDPEFNPAPKMTSPAFGETRICRQPSARNGGLMQWKKIFWAGSRSIMMAVHSVCISALCLMILTSRL